MSYLLYEGPSAIDGGPVVAIVTGIDHRSINTKTGPMAQVWYLRADMNPFEAVKSGGDSAICGNCPAQGTGGKGRYCYVTLLHGPLGIYRDWEARKVKPIPTHWKRFWRNQIVRFGAYGDPASVPCSLTEEIATLSRAHTGYTHQWRTCDQRLRQYLMASVESEEEYHEAKSLGWATFRIKAPDDRRLKWEKTCPASNEGGNKLSCYYCLRCNGSGAKDTVVDVHGTGRGHFINKGDP